MNPDDIKKLFKEKLERDIYRVDTMYDINDHDDIVNEEYYRRLYGSMKRYYDNHVHEEKWHENDHEKPRQDKNNILSVGMLVREPARAMETTRIGIITDINTALSPTIPPTTQVMWDDGELAHNVYNTQLELIDE